MPFTLFHYIRYKSSKQMKIIIVCSLLIAIQYFATSAVIETEPIQLKMIDATELTGDTFDSFTYGKDIIFLFWNSSIHHDRMFKGSTWNMLATEKEKWVTSNKDLIVGEMDCGLHKNKYFCNHFIAFNTSELTYPYIAYSHNNERFKLYNGTMEYPTLTSFLYEYFERNCALNTKWCTETQEEHLLRWKNMTLSEQVQEHILLSYQTDTRIKEFEIWKDAMKKNFSKALDTLQNWTDTQDALSNILLRLIHKHPPENVTLTMKKVKNKLEL